MGARCHGRQLPRGAACVLRLVVLGASLAAGAPSELPCAPQLADWLYDDPKQAPSGYHVVCIRRGKLDLWIGGHGGESARVSWESFSALASLATFRADVEAHAKMKAQSRWKVLDWGLFRTSGERVKTDNDISGLLLAFEGGRWMWPSIRVGFERTVALDLPGGEAMNLTLRTVTVNPLAFSVDGFAEDDVSDHIANKVSPFVRPLKGQKLTSDVPADPRAPSSTTLPLRAKGAHSDARLTTLAERFRGLTKLPQRLQDESFVVTHYEVGQTYAPQHDYYDPVTFRPGKQTNWLKDGRNRLASMFVYLNDVDHGNGGQTNFPLAFSRRAPPGSCVGAQVLPRKGQALLLYNLNPDGSPNPRSLHGGCALLAGAKDVGALWVWNQAVQEPKWSGRQFVPRRKRKQGKRKEKSDEL